MIEVPNKVFDAIRQMKTGPVIEDLTNIPLVIFYMNSVKEPEAADWIRNNQLDYRRGLLEGFAIDNSQEAQLKELHQSDIK